VIWLGRDDEHREITADIERLKALHHLKAVQARHLKVQQDQGIAVLAVQLADLVRIPGGGDGKVAGAAQHFLQQRDVGFLIVNDEDVGLKNVRGADHCIGSL